MSKAEIYDEALVEAQHLPARGIMVGACGKLFGFASPRTFDGTTTVYVYNEAGRELGKTQYPADHILVTLVPATQDAWIDVEWAVMNGERPEVI